MGYGESKTLNIVPFDGDIKKWPMWKTSHRSKLLMNDNDEVYYYLLLSIQDMTTFSIIQSSKTYELKEGDASLSWKKLCDKYYRKYMAMKVKLIMEFTQCKLDQHQNPDIWVTNMENLRWKLEMRNKYIMSDLDFMIRLLANLYSNYLCLSHSFDVQLNQTTYTLTIELLR